MSVSAPTFQICIFQIVRWVIRRPVVLAPPRNVVHVGTRCAERGSSRKNMDAKPFRSSQSGSAGPNDRGRTEEITVGVDYPPVKMCCSSMCDTRAGEGRGGGGGEGVSATSRQWTVSWKVTSVTTTNSVELGGVEPPTLKWGGPTPPNSTEHKSAALEARAFFSRRCFVGCAPTASTYPYGQCGIARIHVPSRCAYGL